MTNPETVPEWEKEFGDKFHNKMKPFDTVTDMQAHNLKYFISSLLRSQQERLVERLEEIIDRLESENAPKEPEQNGYESAIRDFRDEVKSL